jgi:hypothetical protein
MMVYVAAAHSMLEDVNAMVKMACADGDHLNPELFSNL